MMGLAKAHPNKRKEATLYRYGVVTLRIVHLLHYSMMMFISITLKSIVALIKSSHYSRCGLEPSKYGSYVKLMQCSFC